MKRISTFLAATALCSALLDGTPAFAQQTNVFMTKPDCSSTTYSTGKLNYGVITVAGLLCTNAGGGGGGGTASFTAAAAPFSVSAGANKPAGISTANSGLWTIPVKPGTTTEIDLSSSLNRTISAPLGSVAPASGVAVTLDTTDAANLAAIATNSAAPPVPNPLTSTNGSTTITLGNTFQTLLAQNSGRKGCLIQNPADATETLYVSVGIATGSATKAKSFQLSPGASFSCSSGLIVVTDNIAVTAATTSHAFVEVDQ